MLHRLKGTPLMCTGPPGQDVKLQWLHQASAAHLHQDRDEQEGRKGSAMPWQASDRCKPHDLLN